MFFIQVWSRFGGYRSLHALLCASQSAAWALDYYEKLKLLNGLVCWFIICLYVITRRAVVLDLNLFPTSVWQTLSREVSLIQRCRKVMNLLLVLVLGWCLADLHRAALGSLYQSLSSYCHFFHCIRALQDSIFSLRKCFSFLPGHLVLSPSNCFHFSTFSRH